MSMSYLNFLSSFLNFVEFISDSLLILRLKTIDLFYLLLGSQNNAIKNMQVGMDNYV